jgi:glyoxylase-like metal-dependent hydrolase (beta-lactamase superfamily II)
LGIDAQDFAATTPMLLDAVPMSGFDVSGYHLQAPRNTRWLQEGMRIDLGDRQFTVLHLPGHTPASIGLFDEYAGTLFSGDVIYDEVLIDNCVGSHIPDYRRTMHRLIELDVTLVHPGHGDSFAGARLRAIAAGYLERTTTVENPSSD